MDSGIDGRASAADIVLAGGGEMGALMRSIDWTATSLGAVDQWPQSLRTVVSILLNSKYPMFVAWGPELSFLYNDGYRPILGIKHPGALGQSFPEIWPEIWPDISPLVERALVGEPTWSDDLLLFMERNGYPEETYFTFSYSPIRDETGGVGGMFCACTETTERVLSERRIRTLRDLGTAAVEAKTVKDAQALCMRALEANPFDVPFAVLYRLEEAAWRLAGSANVAEGTPVSPSAIERDTKTPVWPVAGVAPGETEIVEDLPDRFGKAAVPASAWGEPVKTAVVLPITGGSRQAMTAALVLGVNPRCALDDPYHEFLRYVGGSMATALASASAHEEERRRAEELAELDRAKTAFFSNVSHEFRTPLTLMLGPLEDGLADREHPLAPAQRERQEIIHRSALRLLRLVNSLLDFSRIEAGRIQAAFEPTDLAALTRDLSSAFRSAVERAGMELLVDCAPLEEPVYVDREMWEKIVLNLLSNAFKHTFEGEIEVRLRPAGDRVALSVRDTGIGIAGKELPHLFERFHRVEGARSRAHEGTGIGLALVQELVRLHGGTVQVSSTLGEGSTFTVEIPMGAAHLPADRVGAARTLASTGIRAAAFVEEAQRWIADDLPFRRDAGERPVHSGEEDGASSGGVRQEGLILLADDNADMRTYVRRLLSERYDVIAVPDGEAALAAARERLPDLVLTDVMMPKLDGFGLLRALRTDPLTRQVPVMMLSARAGEEARVEGMEAGADDYLIKPFSARELLARVNTHLQMARFRREAAAAVEAEGRRMLQLFEQAPVFTALLRGPDYVYELVNDEYHRLVPGRELIGKPLREAVPEVVEQGFIELLDSVYETGTPLTVNAIPWFFDRDGDGKVEEAFLNISYQPFRDASGAIEGVFAVGVDVTDLVRAKQEAEEANRMKSIFLANMSHEIRTPLTAILGFANLLRQLSTGRALGYAERIERSGKRLTETLDAVLTLARLEAGRAEIVLESLDVPSEVREVAALYRAESAAKGLSLTVSVAPGARGARALLDRGAFTSILQNLISNANKFTKEGGIRISVDVAPASPRSSGPERGQAGRVLVSIADTGIGITPEFLPRLFDSFAQESTGMSRSHEGSGLGLSIAKQLVEKMGGAIEVESRRGEGTRFTVSLPLADEAAADADLTHPSAATLTYGTSPRILIVEDHEDTRALMEAMLDGRYLVTACANAPEALATARHEFEASGRAFDMLLIDMNLGDGPSGARLLKDLRALPGYKETPAAVFTAYALPGDGERLLKEGFNAYLRKPFSPEELLGLTTRLYAGE